MNLIFVGIEMTESRNHPVGISIVAALNTVAAMKQLTPLCLRQCAHHHGFYISVQLSHVESSSCQTWQRPKGPTAEERLGSSWSSLLGGNERIHKSRPKQSPQSNSTSLPHPRAPSSRRDQERWE